MVNIRKTTIGMMIAGGMACVVFSQQMAFAGGVAVKEDKPPIVIEASELYFSDTTGDMFAKGNVVVTQKDSKILGDVMRGNAKQQEIWIDDNAVFSQEGARFVGTATKYNYGTQVGTMQKATGQINQEIVTGQQIDFYPSEVILQQGSFTPCQAPDNKPDYHITADKVEIWPNDKMIAYNAKFWIKNVVIFMMPKAQFSLAEGAQSNYPRVGYDSKEGVFILEHIEYPITNHLSVALDLNFLSEAGLKPDVEITNQEGIFRYKVEEGFYRDANDNWIRKEPEFNFQFGHQIGDLPIDYMFTAIYGRWNNQSITSLHQDYNLYFQGHPIKVFGNSSLSLGSGVEVIRESHDDSRSAALRYDAVLSTDWTKKWSTYVGYHYTGQNDALFAFGQPELAREFDSGISYQINEIDKVAYGQPYDMINRRVYERDYFWYHNLQCWLATIEIRAYTQQKTQFVFTLTTNKF